MKELMALKEIQSVNLEIMKDIHSFCVDNHIRYSLAYGSLIGAIRHKGFIPWDDDIDIMMPRPDFELFSKTYKSNKGYELSSVYSADTYVNYTRVYDTHTIVSCPAKASKHPIGIWIDVFPIDAIPDSLQEQKKQFDSIRHYSSLIMRYRFALCNLGKKSLKCKIHGCLQIAKLFFQTGCVCVSKWREQVISLCKTSNWGDTKYCSSLVCVEANRNNKQEVFLTSDFDSYCQVPFENESFYVIEAYDHVLTTIFGDFMQIPPEEKRVSHSIREWSFYRR